MPLTQPERIQISGEILELPLKVAAANAATTQLADVKTDLTNQDNSLKIFFDKYNNIANAYQTERRWVDGTTYSTVTNTDVDNGAQKAPGNKFFPTDGSWIKFQPQKHASTEGLPTSSSPDYELNIFTRSLETNGLIALLDFLLNGQTSGVADDTLGAAYTPGSGTMTVTTGGQTVGNLIIVEGGGFSGLFRVTAAVGPLLTVTEVVPPDGVLPMTTSTVVENIVAFTNTERNTLISTDYQNVLTGITNSIIASVLLWETAINNQLTQLNANGDSRSPQAGEITAAKADITNAKNIIDTWQALPNTGTLLNDSKFVNVNITPLQAEVTARQSFSTTRNTQITTALGSITQNPGDGTYTGSGIYYLRFQQIDARINLAGGPLTEFYEKNISTEALAQIVTNANNRSTTFTAELRAEALSANATGTNVVKVADATGFAVSDTIFVMADGLTELTGTISAIAAPNITLSFTVPNTYTKDLKARIYKQL